MSRPIKSIMQIFAAQSAALVLFVSVIWLTHPHWVVSAIAGGLVFIIPNTYFTYYALSFVGKYDDRWFLAGFYRGQIGKLMLTAVGFVLAFKFVAPLHHLSLFLSFCLMMLVNLIAAPYFCSGLSKQNGN